MKNEFVPYEIALELKQLGFDEPCIGCYTENAIGKGDKLQYFATPITCNNDYVFVSAPLYQQAFRWFREKYDLQCSINFYSESLGIKKVPNHYEIQIDYLSNNKWRYFEDTTIYLTYEESEMACLEKLIEIVKTI